MKSPVKNVGINLGEDATWMGMFNYLQRGFEKPPTDYYLRPYGEAADELIGTNKKLNANLCHGPRKYIPFPVPKIPTVYLRVLSLFMLFRFLKRIKITN